MLLQVSGERGPAPGARVARERFTQFGRGALRSVIALDEAGRNGSGGDTAPQFGDEPEGIVTLRNVLPDWSVRLLVGSLLLPALLAALDAFFRARRRPLAIGAWLAWTLAAGVAVPLRLGLAARARDRRRVPGAARAGRSRRPAAGDGRGGGAGIRRGRRRGGSARRASTDARRARGTREPGGGRRGRRGRRARLRRHARGLARQSVRCPLLLPAAHLWLFLGVPQTRLRGAIAWAALAAGLLAPLLVLAYEARALRAGPLELARMWLVATAGGHVSPWSALALGVLAGCFATLVRILLARRRIAAAAPPEQLHTRGPAGYAGPGSLGGTESALRR